MTENRSAGSQDDRSSTDSDSPEEQQDLFGVDPPDYDVFEGSEPLEVSGGIALVGPERDSTNFDDSAEGTSL